MSQEKEQEEPVSKDPTSPVEPADRDAHDIASVAELFAGGRINPAQWLKRARTSGIRVLGDDEMENLVAQIVGNAKQLDRLLGALRRLSPKQVTDGASPAVLDIAERVLAVRVPDVFAPPDDPEIDVVIHAAEQLRDADGPARDRQRWLEVLLRTTYLRRRIAPEGLAGLVRVAYGPKAKKTAKPKKTKGSSVAPAPAQVDEAQILFSLLGKPQVLSGIAAIARIHQRKLNELGDALQHREMAIGDLQKKREQLEQECAQRAATIADRDDEIAKLKSAAEQLQAASDARQTRALHDIETLRGRMRGVLKGDLTTWLETARDAAMASPPRIAVVTERLERALERAAKEAQWLASSDST